MSKANLLRAITQRINHTPVKELPAIACFLASSVQSCGDILKSSSGISGGKNDDLAVQVQKLKARITSLLQHRSPQGRFTGIVILKATVEAGGREILASCEPWVRGLLAILNRPDPVSSKRLCLITITRIFSLTQYYPTLIREITTPLLPAFVTACMNLGALQPTQDEQAPPSRPNPYLETVLQCMLQLIPHHPNTFRPFVSKLHTALIKLIGNQFHADNVTHLAGSVFVALHFCAPKNTAGDEWQNACKAVIRAAHSVADQVLRAVVEDWQPSHNSGSRSSVPKVFDEMPHSTGGDLPGLPAWHGLHQGSMVLISLFHLLETFVGQQTSQMVNFPLGAILDLASRFLYIRVPGNGKEHQTNVRFNPEVGRDEREELLAILPEFHKSTLNLFSSLVEVLEKGLLPVSHTILDHCLWTFEPDNSTEEVRLYLYLLLEKLLPLMGGSMTKDSAKQLSGVLSFCCKDMLSRKSERELIDRTPDGSKTKPAVNGHADSFLQSASQKNDTSEFEVSVLETAASSLLCQTLEHIPADLIPHSLRAQIDRTIILSDDKRAMLASVLNPPPRKSGRFTTPSIIPFLARSSQTELEVESLLRPRMPVIRDSKAHAADFEADSDEDVAYQHPVNLGAVGREESSSLVQPRTGGTGPENDILDRLEDSIEDGAISASEGTVSQNRNGGDMIVEPFSPRTDGQPEGNGLLPGAKRNIETIEDRAETERHKRSRTSDFDLQSNPVHRANETTTGGSAPISAMADPDTVVPVENAGVGASILNKGKGRAERVSPRPEEGLRALAKENENISDDDDDESDSEIPPLYLKTSSEEEDEDEDEEMV